MDSKTFQESFHFSPDQGTPLYEQLLSYFRLMIQIGELQPGDRLIPENELCSILQVSRTTVRQAMDQLVAEGLIVRYKGRGSFVASPKMKRPIHYLYNFTENIRELGAVPSSVILHAAVEIADPALMKTLELPETQPQVFHLTRIRCANESPILLEDTYVPYYLCRGIEEVDFQYSSLYQTLEDKYQLKLHHATETIEAILMGTSDAATLQCQAGIPGYRIRRRSQLESGHPFEYTSSITNAERCMFQLELYKNNTPSKPGLNFQRQVTL